MPRYRRRKKVRRKTIAIKRPRINEQITALEVRLLDEDGKNLDVIKTPKAIEIAKEKGMDLIEISGKAVPPVARIANYGKFIYALEKKSKEERKTISRKDETKSVRVRPGTSIHDLEMKARTIDKFLGKGYKVQVEVHLRGREKAFQDLAHKKIEELLTHIQEPYRVDKELQKSPRGLSMRLTK